MGNYCANVEFSTLLLFWQNYISCATVESALVLKVEEHGPISDQQSHRHSWIYFKVFQ